MRPTIALFVIVWVAVMQLICPPWLLASPRSQLSALQVAVNNIYVSPRLARRQLQRLSSPTAKAYLAFLYKSGKVKVPNAQRLVDRLMNQAIATTTVDRTALADVEQEGKNHYSGMKLLIRDLRFITDADGNQAEVPWQLFAEYPQSAFDGFASYWGSSRDSRLGLSVPDSASVDRQLSSVRQLLSELDSISYQPALCKGTMEYAYRRDLVLAVDQASLAPQLLERSMQSAQARDYSARLERFLRIWSNRELWNKRKYYELECARAKARYDLSNFYSRKFHVSQKQGQTWAKAAETGISLVCLNRYPQAGVDEEFAGALYKTFTIPHLSLVEMKRKLGSMSLNNDLLSQALRLAILNSADVDVIDWLVKRGASLTNQAEPALLSAVTRPAALNALLNNGAYVNQVNRLGKTALIQAAQYNQFDSLRLLVERGADINRPMYSPACRQVQAMKYDCDIEYDIGCRTALMYAAAFSSPQSVLYLLDHGADKNMRDSDGRSAVDFISWNHGLSPSQRQLLRQKLKI